MPSRLSQRIFGIFVASIICLFCSSEAEKLFDNQLSGKQHPLNVQARAKRIAVIGAGSGGASAAYYLKRYANEAGIDTDITVFERSSHVGGRSTTINVYDNPLEPVEVGGAIFVKVNKNLVAAAEAFGLSIDSADSLRPNEAPERLGVWNGDEFVFKQNEGGYYWWNIAKLLWKYGLTPLRTRNLMKETVGNFLKMYEAPYFPFRSLSETAFDLGLTAATAATGEEFLAANNIQPPFARDIIQASTRVNYGQNLGLIHGLETMVCMAIDGAMAIKGGNWQMFDGMLKAAGANLVLDTEVTEIRRGENKKSVVTSRPSHHSANTLDPLAEEYDTVIIASPLQFSRLNIIPALSKPPDEIPYVTLHVTLFTSPHKISPLAFNLQPDDSVPQTILTTLKPDEQASNQVGNTVFFSISILRTVQNPSTNPPRQEYLYKIFSPAPINSTFLAHILGIPAPATSSSDLAKEDVGWRYNKIWQSYPYLYPRVTFEEIRLGQDLWYTSGIESFISTMETSSLMGMNVARLIADDWLGIERKSPRA